MKKIVIGIAVLILFILLKSYFRVSDEDILKAREAVRNGAIIVDVRTPEEFREKHISDAINVPVESIMKGTYTFPKDSELVVYCRTGSRSAASANVLRERGWIVHDVATQSDWEREIDTNVKNNVTN